MKREVVITGIGCVTSIGNGVKEFSNALRNGKSNVSKISVFETEGFDHFYGCEVQNFDPSPYIEKISLENIGRSSQFSVSSARMAIEDAGYAFDDVAKLNCGVSVGTTDGESHSIDQLVKEYRTHGSKKISPHLIRQIPAQNISYNIAREFGLKSGALTISTACSAGNYAIGHAYDRIMCGEVDTMICGGADSMCRKTFAGFYRLGTISPNICQPFDKDRKGILTGEGAGILFLETRESAEKRGAKIYAEILGYGLNCDADHMVSPNSNSIANCMQLAHKNAGILASEVDYISAHGTGTIANDIAESKAIKQVFKDTLPPVSSIKSMLGHTMGAASALASIGCALALDQEFIPPTINHKNTDPECGIDPVPNKARHTKLRIVQNNGFAFGGNNAITLFKK